MNEIDAYLNEVCWAMGGGFAAQQAARDELREHILEAAREFELAGVAAPDAVRRALGELGPAEAIGRALRGSRGTSALRRALVQPEGALVLEPARNRHVPTARLGAALLLLFAMAATVAGIYFWPT